MYRAKVSDIHKKWIFVSYSLRDACWHIYAAILTSSTLSVFGTSTTSTRSTSALRTRSENSPCTLLRRQNDQEKHQAWLVDTEQVHIPEEIQHQKDVMIGQDILLPSRFTCLSRSWVWGDVVLRTVFVTAYTRTVVSFVTVPTVLGLESRRPSTSPFSKDIVKRISSTT